MNKAVENTFLSNNAIVHSDGERYIVLETSKRTNEMLVLRLRDQKAYLYYDGNFTPIDLDRDRSNGQYFTYATIHNWVA